MDHACDESVQACVVKLKAKLIGTMNQPKKAIYKVEKLLIVSEPKQTTMYMTLKSPDVCCNVKHTLETLLFEPFGDEVLKRADKSLHPMNLKDKTRIENGSYHVTFRLTYLKFQKQRKTAANVCAARGLPAWKILANGQMKHK